MSYPRCAGPDMHKDTAGACVGRFSAPVAREVRAFVTATREVPARADWLACHVCTAVAMASCRKPGVGGRHSEGCRARVSRAVFLQQTAGSCPSTQ
jgi:hypothetical protein